MMIQAVLSNPNHPEYGVATIPFPIPRDQYAHCMELLEALEIGDAVKADCKVQAINSFYTVLKRTEMLTVNVEELNYLAKRLDSFDTGEAAQFQAMAHKLELFELKDLINLTFCCQQATVITDFSDLAAIGRDHYMNLHGGCAKTEELDALDSVETARRLIESGSGTITPCGVVYDNGMKLEPVYDGRFFPCYYYEPNVITVAVTSKSKPEDTEHITWLFLPMEREELDRTLLRGGITDPTNARLRLEDSQLPNEVDVLLDMEYETLYDLNGLAETTDGLSNADMEKLGAVVMLAEPKSAAQIKNLAESLDLFDFAPGTHTPEEYGKYMIRQSGHFEYDENLDAFYDYEKYGTERMNAEDGMFTDRGYIAYKGYISMEEVMNGGQSNHMVMGGLSR
ncbi:antirestriction protein ArdA [Dysosmobacter sp.]|uniref:antirestriction protein ArdA n=1 Tax=Dysosmobacter sp. TaxID=2591382 RepID=UPI003AB2AA54